MIEARGGDPAKPWRRSVQMNGDRGFNQRFLKLDRRRRALRRSEGSVARRWWMKSTVGGDVSADRRRGRTAPIVKPLLVMQRARAAAKRRWRSRRLQWWMATTTATANSGKGLEISAKAIRCWCCSLVAQSIEGAIGGNCRRRLRPKQLQIGAESAWIRSPLFSLLLR